MTRNKNRYHRATGVEETDLPPRVPRSEVVGNDHKRIQEILAYIPDQATVLDVGCARHTEAQRQKGNLHEILNRYTGADVIGIDVVESEIERMQANGYDARLANAETFSLDETFDIIVAGELIEHLANPGRFLERARDHLADDGKIVITTPNPDGFVFWRKALTGQTNNETHTCWIDPANLDRLVSLVDGLELDEWSYLPPQGGISGILWKAGFRRGASPGYIATIN